MKSFSYMAALAAIASYTRAKKGAYGSPYNGGYRGNYGYAKEPCQNLFFFESEEYPNGDCGMPEYTEIFEENHTVFQRLQVDTYDGYELTLMRIKYTET